MQRFSLNYSSRRHSAPECAIRSLQPAVRPIVLHEPLYYTVQQVYDSPTTVLYNSPSSVDEHKINSSQTPTPIEPEAHLNTVAIKSPEVSLKGYEYGSTVRSEPPEVPSRDYECNQSSRGESKTESIANLFRTLSTDIDNRLAAATERISRLKCRALYHEQNKSRKGMLVRNSNSKKFALPCRKKSLHRLRVENHRLKEQLGLLSEELEKSIGELTQVSGLVKEQLFAVTSKLKADLPKQSIKSLEETSEKKCISPSISPIPSKPRNAYGFRRVSNTAASPTASINRQQQTRIHRSAARRTYESHVGCEHKRMANSQPEYNGEIVEFDAVEFADLTRRKYHGNLPNDKRHSFKMEDLCYPRIRKRAQWFTSRNYYDPSNTCIPESYFHNHDISNDGSAETTNSIQERKRRSASHRCGKGRQRYREDPRIFVTPLSATPVNAAYYMGGMYNPAYVPSSGEASYAPYAQSVYIDPASYSAYYGAYGGQTGAYRGYPQPQPSPLQYRRSRTAPARTLPRSTNYPTAYTKRTRGYSVDPYYFDQRYYRSYSGPTKNARNMPMYRKKREPNSRIITYQETEFGGAPVDSQSQYYPSAYSDAVPTLRRIRPYYSPSYTTYPPSIMNPSRSIRKDAEKNYSIALRVAMKAAEVIFGAAILGLILGPMRDYPFHIFVTMTKTEWQGLVVGIVSCFSVLALVMLITSCFAHKQLFWQRIDYFISIVGTFGYLLAGAIEAYFAACYPPTGEKIGQVCHLAEWIIATVLIFINFIIYIIDCVFSFRTGISML